MKITALLENTSNDIALKPKHGLSIYIETSERKVLFDLGPDDTYLHNAKKLGINIAEVDTVVISHGHFDHGGALSGFMKINNRAKIYLHRQAFEPHYAKVYFIKKAIGLDKSLQGNDRFVMTDGAMQIDDEMFLFSDVIKDSETKSSRVLLKKTTNGYIQDDFAHEQNLIMTADGKTALFSGCSHKGIENILRTAKKHKPVINAVFGGFHLYNPATKAAEPPEVVQRLIDGLSAYDSVFYTGHCTGKKAFECMRESMGEKMRYMSTGTTIEI